MAYAVDNELMAQMVTNQEQDLLSLSRNRTVMLVFLRHFGCVFCKEALSDLAERQSVIKNKGIELVFVHMSEKDVAEDYFKRYRLAKSVHISDPFCQYYAAFGIVKGNFSQLYGLRTWIRGFAAKRQGHELELARALGDSTQMPGIFIIKDGTVVDKFIHKHASDRPDYDEIIDRVAAEA